MPKIKFGCFTALYAWLADHGRTFREAIRLREHAAAISLRRSQAAAEKRDKTRNRAHPGAETEAAAQSAC